MATYWEMHGWPRGRWERGAFDGERRLMCAWSDILLTMAELDANLFWPYAANQYPWGAADALIYSADVIPFGKSTATGGDTQKYNSYEWAMIVCKYTTRGPKYYPGKGYVEETLDPAFQSYTVDSKNLRWKSDDKQVEPNDAPTAHDALLEYQVAFTHLETLPAWILTYPGGVNASTVTTLGFGISFPAQTLKYMGCALKGTYSLGWQRRYTLVAKFVYKWSGWNTFWRHDSTSTNKWEAIKVKGDGDYIQHQPINIVIG